MEHGWCLAYYLGIWRVDLWSKGLIILNSASKYYVMSIWMIQVLRLEVDVTYYHWMFHFWYHKIFRLQKGN
jgi:hypothetical protein